MEGKGPIGRRKGSFLKLDRPFEGPKGLFIAKIDRSGCGNDPFGDPIGPPEEEIDPFGDTNDWLNEKKDFFQKKKDHFRK